MANYTVPEAAEFLDSTVWVELFFDDPECGYFHSWRCVRIVGVVLSLEGVYEHPHFLGFDPFNPSKYPDEVFWSDIRSITRVKPTNGRRTGSKRAHGSSRSKRAHAPAMLTPRKATTTIWSGFSRLIAAVSRRF